MLIKINSIEGRSWKSYIDEGLTFVEIENIYPNTKIGVCIDGFKLKKLFNSLGHEVEYNFCPCRKE